MDSHDLFRKLCNGVKFNKKSLVKGSQLSGQDSRLKGDVEVKTSNAAEEWMNSGDRIKSEDESSVDQDGLGEESNCAQENQISLPHECPSNLEAQRSVKSYRSENSSIAIFGSKRKSSESEALDFLSSKAKKLKGKLSAAEKLKTQEEEKINILRKHLQLCVSGGGVPAPVTSFNELKERYNVSSTLISNLLKSGYTEPTPIQTQAWPVMLEKRQVLACAPTGSGKTAAFLIPLIHQLRGLRHDGIRAVIISPTRELAQQTYRECSRLSDGMGLNIHMISKVNTNRSKLNLEHTHKYDILLTTPNRLLFLLKQEPPVLSLHNVEWLIVDESDKLFEAGPRGFRDQLAAIYKACDSQNVKRAMFSATHGAHVARWCKENLKGVVAITVGHRNTTVDKVDQELVFVGSEHGKLLAMRDMITKGLQPPVLIFVQSKERAKELFSELLYDGINVEVIHADRSQLQRDNVVRSFREGKLWVLICTELMGRGIDFKGVNLVINYDFPPSAISYIHRIGRTGRAGRSGKAITFFTESDSHLLRSIATVMRDSGCEVPQFMLDLKKPNKTTKKKLESRVPDRERISTVPLSAKKQEKLKIKIVNAKRKKRGLPPLPEEPKANSERKSCTELGGRTEKIRTERKKKGHKDHNSEKKISVNVEKKVFPKTKKILKRKKNL